MNGGPKPSPKILHPDFIGVKGKCFTHVANVHRQGSGGGRYIDEETRGGRMRG